MVPVINKDVAIYITGVWHWVFDSVDKFAIILILHTLRSFIHWLLLH